MTPSWPFLLTACAQAAFRDRDFRTNSPSRAASGRRRSRRGLSFLHCAIADSSAVPRLFC